MIFSRKKSSQDSLILREVRKVMETEAEKPLTVSVMGKTGVGKTSLLNALFGTNLATDSVRPCTKDPEPIVVKGNSEHELVFYDCPGIGESEEADLKYLKSYAKLLIESDIVLWAIEANSRDVLFDVQTLRQLLNQFGQEQKSQLISKITFVLTKADTLFPPPWILGKINKEYGVFTPTPPIQEILEEKATYFQEVLIYPYRDLIVGQTYQEGNFQLEEHRISYDQHTIFYDGFLDQENLNRLMSKYPNYRGVFERLYDNYKVIYCSSNLRFNLSQLMLVILNKLGFNAISRFTKFYNNESLNQVPLVAAKGYCNLIVVDPVRKRKIFDMNDLNI